MSRRRKSHGLQKPLPGVLAGIPGAPGSAAWLFNESGGTTARDSIGNDHAVLVGTGLTRSAAQSGYGAISGFTSASYITTTRNTKAAYTLVARIKHGGSISAGYRSIFGAVGTAYVLHGLSDGATFQFWSSTEYSLGTNFSTTLTQNRWYTMAFVREGNSITNGYKLYWDGTLDATMRNTGTLASPTNPFWIGMRSDGYNHPWDGGIEWVQWYERALTASEIQALVVDPFAAWSRPGPRMPMVEPPASPPPPTSSNLLLLGVG